MLPAWLKSSSTLALLGAGGVMLVAIVLTHQRDAKRAIPAPPTPGPGPRPDGRPAWRPLPVGQPISMLPGLICRACVELPTLLPTSMATPERVRDYAAKRGFANVYSTTSRPGDWPGACEADLFVQAQWARGAESMPWPDGITAAWVLA